MMALARPGTIRRIEVGIDAPATLDPAAAAVALALCDFESTVWLDETLARDEGVTEFLRFHTSAPVIAEKGLAAFAFFHRGGELPPFEAFALGSLEYPDRSTTLVVPVEHLADDGGWRLTGPGVAGEGRFSAGPLPADIWRGSRATTRSSRCGSTSSSLRRPRSPRCPAPRSSKPEEARCMSPSRVARRRSTTPTRCSPTRGGATLNVPEISTDQIREQLPLAVDRVMAEGSLYDPELAALAIKQARGDLIEAIFLLRAYRTTLPRFGASEPLDTGAHAHPPPHLGHLQGPAGRPGARPDLRLHAPPDRFRACRRGRPPLAERRRRASRATPCRT